MTTGRPGVCPWGFARRCPSQASISETARRPVAVRPPGANKAATAHERGGTSTAGAFMGSVVGVWLTWRAAMRDALYGGGGFYSRGERRADHFGTSVHASRRYGEAVLTLVCTIDAVLGQPGRPTSSMSGQASLCWPVEVSSER